MTALGYPYSCLMYPQTLVDRQGLGDTTGEPPHSHARADSHRREFGTIFPTYGMAMPPLDVRRHQFAVFVRRATDHAKLTRGWSIPEVAKRTGVGVATIYRWLNEQWTDNPDPGLIEKFCDGLNLSPGEAFMILWPGKNAKNPPAAIMHSEPDFETLQRKLNDPSTSEQEKFLIRETIRTLALRGK